MHHETRGRLVPGKALDGKHLRAARRTHRPGKDPLHRTIGSPWTSGGLLIRCYLGRSSLRPCRCTTIGTSSIGGGFLDGLSGKRTLLSGRGIASGRGRIRHRSPSSRCAGALRWLGAQRHSTVPGMSGEPKDEPDEPVDEITDRAKKQHLEVPGRRRWALGVLAVVGGCSLDHDQAFPRMRTRSFNGVGPKLKRSRRKCSR